MPFLASEADIHILAAGGNQRVVKSAARVFPIFQQGAVSIGNQYIAGVEENLAKEGVSECNISVPQQEKGTPLWTSFLGPAERRALMDTKS